MTITVGGDFFPNNDWQTLISKDSKSIWDEKLLHEFGNSNHNIINLECAITNSNSSIVKDGPCLKSDKVALDALNSANIDVVTLANNHISDFGELGIKDTLNALREKSIKYLGAGMDILEASKHIEFGNDIALINYTHNEFRKAEQNVAGFNPFSIVNISRKIRKLKEEGKYVILILHMGHERYHFPSPRIQDQFRFFIEQGADVLLTHHSHFPSGYERHKNGLIFYGLGNLLFDGKNEDFNWHQGYLVQLKIRKKKCEDFKIIPYQQSIEYGQIKLLTGKRKINFDIWLGNINEIISNKSLLEKEWEKKVNEDTEIYLNTILRKNKFLPGIVRRFPFTKNFIYKKNKNLRFLNYIRCETHYETLIDVISKNSIS